jgi:hypothetical protein
MRFLILATLLLACRAHAQMAGPVVMISERARMTVDSIAALARRDELEPGACVTSYLFQNDTITIHGLGPADLAERARGTLRWNGKVCHDSLPSLHGHFMHMGHWDRPTPADWIVATHESRARAPFHLILLIEDNGVGSKLIPYAVKKP